MGEHELLADLLGWTSDGWFLTRRWLDRPPAWVSACSLLVAMHRLLGGTLRLVGSLHPSFPSFSHWQVCVWVWVSFYFPWFLSFPPPPPPMYRSWVWIGPPPPQLIPWGPLLPIPIHPLIPLGLTPTPRRGKVGPREIEREREREREREDVDGVGVGIEWCLPRIASHRIAR